MPETLFLNTIRYLHSLHQKNDLSDEQIRKLAECVLEVTAAPDAKTAGKTAPSRKTAGFLDVETAQILREVVPELRNTLQPFGDESFVMR